VSFQHEYIITLKCRDDFDLEKTLSLHPFLFFYEPEPKRGFIFKGKKLHAEFHQKDNAIKIKIHADTKLMNNELGFLRNRLNFCLGCDENLEEFFEIVEKDEVLRKYSDRIYGTRIPSAFDEFEALVCIIFSQNTSLKNYRRYVRNLIDLCGDGVFFPTPIQVLKLKDELYTTGAGYRVDYVIKMAEYFSTRDKFYIPKENELIEIKGIGKYSRDIYYLLQLRDYGRMYFDRLIQKILLKSYGYREVDESKIKRMLQSLFGKFCGLAELYLQLFLNPYNR